MCPVYAGQFILGFHQAGGAENPSGIEQIEAVQESGPKHRPGHLVDGQTPGVAGFGGHAYRFCQTGHRLVQFREHRGVDLRGKVGRRTVGKEVDRPLLADDGNRTLVDCMGRVDRRTDVAAGVGDGGVVEQEDGGHVLGGHVLSEPGQPLAPHPTNVAGQMILHRYHPLRMPHPERRWHHPRSAPAVRRPRRLAIRRSRLP